MPPRCIAAPPDDLSLSFVNTRYWRGRDTPTEELPDADALLAWAGRTGGVPASLLTPGAAAGYAGAIELREALYRIFSSLADAVPAPPADLAVVNAALASAVPRQRLERQAAGYAWSVEAAPSALAALLSPVLWSAADLLAGPRHGRVRLCANPQCRWAFLDDSKSGNRRWCSMAACGNRAKAQRHYLRHRQKPTG